MAKECAYELERFQDEPPNSVVCTICMAVVKVPVETTCEHLFCKVCITEWQAKGNTCPNCKQVLKIKPKPNRILLDLYHSLKIFCKNKEYGCPEILTVKEIESHQAQCGYEYVMCSNNDSGTGCTLKIQRRLLEDHLKSCKFRKITCNNGCGLVIYAKDCISHNCIDCLLKQISGM